MTIPLWSTTPPDDVKGAASAPDEIPNLVPFLLQDGTPRACVVVCPGGGYWRRADHEGNPVAHWLNTLGIAAVVLHYRVQRRFPGSLRDAERAVRLVRHNAAAWGIDPQRVGILGFSAGGHLAASACTLGGAGDATASDPVERESARPDFGVLCYPVITAYEGRHNGSIAMLLGDEPWDDALRAQVSLDRQVTAQTPPCFLWHTADDGAVPLRNTLDFAAACAQHGVGVSAFIAPHGRHGLGLAQDDPEVGSWRDACANWLRYRKMC